MSGTAVVYKSNYGTTKKYAEWIAEELSADLFEAGKITVQQLKTYDTIVYGGGLYASGILGVQFITKNYDVLKEKKLVVFTVGLANPEIKEQFLPIINRNFTPEMRETIHIYHFRGGVDYKNLSVLHKSMMAMLRAKVSKIDEEHRDDETKLMLETYGQVVDFTDRRYIEPLISDVQDD